MFCRIEHIAAPNTGLNRGKMANNERIDCMGDVLIVSVGALIPASCIEQQRIQDESSHQKWKASTSRSNS